MLISSFRGLFCEVQIKKICFFTRLQDCNTFLEIKRKGKKKPQHFSCFLQSAFQTDSSEVGWALTGREHDYVLGKKKKKSKVFYLPVSP